MIDYNMITAANCFMILSSNLSRPRSFKKLDLTLHIEKVVILVALLCLAVKVYLIFFRQYLPYKTTVIEIRHFADIRGKNLDVQYTFHLTVKVLMLLKLKRK